MKAKIIYNPKSGKRKLQPRMSDVVEILSQSHYRVEVYPTRYSGDAIEAGRRACEDEYDLVIAVGGDGTISEVVNGMAPFDKRPVLGYIPSGTSNDFAAALGIPRDLKKCLDIIINGKKTKIDIGDFNKNKTFNYIVAAGAFTRLTYTTPHKLKRLFGVMAYLKDLVREIPLIRKPFRLSLTVDGKHIEGEFVIALVINSPNFAGLRGVLPMACMDDGVFDILLLPKSSPSKFIKTLQSIALGKGISDKHLKGTKHIQGKKIKIDSDKQLNWNIDGELGGQGGIEITCKEKFLEMMVPNSIYGSIIQHQTD